MKDFQNPEFVVKCTIFTLQNAKEYCGHKNFEFTLQVNLEILDERNKDLQRQTCDLSHLGGAIT
jgi:hypothetical protein